MRYLRGVCLILYCHPASLTYMQSVVRWGEVAQSCLTLCDPKDCSLPGSSLHGIFQARILEWVTISFSRGSSQPRNQTQVSCIAGRSFTLWATREALSPLATVILENHNGFSLSNKDEYKTFKNVQKKTNIFLWATKMYTHIYMYI